MYFLSFQAKHFRHPINRAVMDHDNSNNDGGFVRSNCAPGFSCARYSALPQNPLYVMAPTRTKCARILLNRTGSAL